MTKPKRTTKRTTQPTTGTPDCGIGCYWDLCDQYQVWTVKEGLLGLGCAAEHVQDESLTEEQRAWLRGFVERCELAERWEAELCSRLSLDKPERLRQYSVRLDDSAESPLLSFAMVNDATPEVIEALFPVDFASVDGRIRLVARVVNETGADPWYRCICGNDPERDGFSASDSNGALQIVEGGGPSEAWDGRHYRCNSCGAYFDHDQTDLVVVGRAVPTNHRDT